MHYIGVALGVFVSFFIMTKYLDPEVIGLTKVLYEIAFLLSTFASLGAGSVGMRFFPYFKDEATGDHGFFYYFRLMPAAGIVLFSLLFIVLQQPIISFFGHSSEQLGDYIYFVLPLFWVLTIWQFFESFANIHMRIAIPKGVREVGMRLMQLGIFLAYGFHLIDITGVVVSYIVCYGVCMVTDGIYCSHIGSMETRHDWHFFTPNLRVQVLKYAGFLTLATISGNVLSQVDVFMLSSVKGLYDVGIYTIVLYMAEVVNMPSRSITPIASPLAAQAIKEGDMEQATSLYRQVSVHQTLASSVLLLFVWINLDNIFSLIPRGTEYEAGKWAVLFMGLGKILYSMLNFGNTLISFSRYYYWTLVFTIVLTFVSIGTNLYFIPLYGINGAALATLIAILLSYAFQQVLVQWKLKCNPFSWAHLRIVLVVVILYGINFLIPSLLSADRSVLSAIGDGVVRSLVLGLIAVALIYVFRISEQINGMIRKLGIRS